MKKQLQLFLTRDDESQLSQLLKAELSDIRFLNDHVWHKFPDCRDGIEDCDSGRAYLYHGSLELLPTMRLKTGDIEGPAAGCVIQILRSLPADGVLYSGRIAAGIDHYDDRMREFVCKVWSCVRQIGSIGVVRPDGKVDKKYIVGYHARRAVVDGVITIADRAVGIHYEPLE